MAISQDMLQLYQNNVPGSLGGEIKWKREALKAIAELAPTEEEFIKHAQAFVQDANGECVPPLIKCADGSCVSDKTQCNGRGGPA